MSPSEGALPRLALKQLPADPDTIAPDGSHVRILLALHHGSLAHFELSPGRTSVAVAHRTVDEIWFFLQGRGQMWRRLGAEEDVAEVGPGTCLTLPVGTQFQFRALGPEPLAALGVTMPPWPGVGEAYVVEGPWPASVEPGPA